jgi:hypothetical protein
MSEPTDRSDEKLDETMKQDKPSFLKNHADTVAIIGVNIAIAAILVMMIISNSNRIDAVNVRADHLYNILIDLIKEKRA